MAEIGTAQTAIELMYSLLLKYNNQRTLINQCLHIVLVTAAMNKMSTLSILILNIWVL